MKKYDLIKEARKHNLNVEFSDYGIASRLGNTIIINKNMLKYDEFCRKVFDHEIRHTSKMTKNDFVMDLFEGSIYENMKFCLRHPKAFTQYIPIGVYKKKVFVDMNQLIIYAIILTMVGAWYLLMT